MTQKDGVKYFDQAKGWQKERIDIVYIEEAAFEMGCARGKWLKEHKTGAGVLNVRRVF
jgi:hypothetical protein